MSSTPGPSRGLPIRPPPITESDKCRQCDKEFNIVWRRSHACGHCGFEYCSSCISDGQALMPRRPGQETKGKGPFAELKAGLGLDDRPSSSSSSGSGYGYEVENVCVPCLGMLQVTCAPVQSLRNLPLKRLKEYLAAYNIPNVGPKEKEDFVQAIIKARNPRTGALSPEAETYYRRHSVPKKSGVNGNGATARPTPGQGPGPSRPQHAQARPPPPQANNNYNRPPPPQTSYRSSAPTGQYRPPPGNYYRPPPTPPQFQHLPQNRSTPSPAQARTPAPTAPAPAKAKTPPPPVPTIMGLVALPNSYLSTLSIGTLKAILYENHVKVDFKQVLEKQELIGRVAELISAERKRLERQRYEEERLAQGDSAVSAATEGDDAHAQAGVTDKAQVPTGPLPEIERGLCVVCQDEEATLAVVDCGHLAMCQHCSELIMATSQECPLCRTRIITSQRLIRIYRV